MTRKNTTEVQNFWQADEIASRLSPHPVRNGRGWLVNCPKHDDATPSLSIGTGWNGQLLVHCFAGCNPVDILREIRNRHQFIFMSPTRTTTIPRQKMDRTRILERLWNSSRPLSGSVAAVYLKNRGITWSQVPLVLRCHPSLEVYENGKATGQRFPALVAFIESSQSEFCGLHLTYLTEDGSGKAEIASPRRILGVREGSTKGGAVRLMAPVNGVIGLAEGLETAFSAYLLTNTPVWSCLNAGGIERAILPAEIRKVVIFADRDPAGLKAAANACQRFRSEGRESEIMVPNEKGLDFNDALKKARTSVTA